MDEKTYNEIIDRLETLINYRMVDIRAEIAKQHGKEEAYNDIMFHLNEILEKYVDKTNKEEE